jgi:hypothetical protein
VNALELTLDLLDLSRLEICFISVLFLVYFLIH